MKSGEQHGRDLAERMMRFSMAGSNVEMEQTGEDAIDRIEVLTDRIFEVVGGERVNEGLIALSYCFAIVMHDACDKAQMSNYLDELEAKH